MDNATRLTTPTLNRSRGRRTLTGVVGLFAVAAILACAAGASDDTADGDNSAAAGKQAPKAAGLGDRVRDGKFEFVVSKVECGKTKIGDQYVNKKAQGQFCLVSMTVKNIGDEPQSMFADNQKLFDSKDREYSADTEAGIYLGESNNTIWEEINPGNKIKGVVVFDVPKNVKPVKLELHDSAFSGGVMIKL